MTAGGNGRGSLEWRVGGGGGGGGGGMSVGRFERKE